MAVSADPGLVMEVAHRLAALDPDPEPDPVRAAVRHGRRRALARVVAESGGEGRPGAERAERPPAGTTAVRHGEQRGETGQ